MDTMGKWKRPLSKGPWQKLRKQQSLQEHPTVPARAFHPVVQGRKDKVMRAIRRYGVVVQSIHHVDAR